MGIRSWIGLCEHQWKDTGDVIRTSVRSIVTPSDQPIVTGYAFIRKCIKCGIVRSFKL